MPTVAVVEGVKIQFFAEEHPPAHFHAVFAEHRAQIDLATFRVLKGRLPRRKLSVVVAWAATRRGLLERAWRDTIARRKPEKIR